MPLYDVKGNPVSSCCDINGNLVSSLFNKDSELIEAKSEYIKDGLELWLDGEFNGGENTHLETPSNWSDLSGNGFDFNLINVGVSANSMTFDGLTSRAVNYSSALTDILYSLQERTIEIVCKFNDTENAQVVFLGKGNTLDSNGAVGLWYRPTSGGFKVSTFSNKPTIADKIDEISSYSIKFGDTEASDYVLYQNGNSCDMATSATGTMANTTATTIGARLYNSSYGYYFNGEIYCIRVYNRQLTDAERLNNFLIDKERFNIVTPYDLTVMSFNIQRWSGINSDIDLMNTIFNKYKPDIVGFQEYYTSSTIGDYSTADYLKSLWSYSEVGVPTVGDYYTKAVASDYYLEDAISVDYSIYSEKRSYQKMYVTIGDKRIAVFNTHLDVTSAKNSEGVQYKALQCAELLEAVSQEEYFIIIGDFNTTCQSTEDADYVNQIKQFVDAGYNCANCSEQFGFNNTWTDGTSLDDVWYPTDHIITSSNITINEVVVDTLKVEADTGLTIDHLPLVAYLTVN